MPTQPVANVALVEVKGVMDNQLTINTSHWAISGGGINITNLTTLVDAVADWAANTLAPLLSRDWTLTQTAGTDLTSNIGPAAFNNTTQIGGVDIEAAPNNVAACVSIRTGGRGRSFRGRNFLPGIPNSLVTLNTLDTGFISDLLGAYTGLIGAGTFVAGWEYSIVSRRLANEDRIPPLVIPVVSVEMVGTSVRSMRSREVGHGA